MDKVSAVLPSRLPLFPSATVVSNVSGVPLLLTSLLPFVPLLLMRKFQQKGVGVGGSVDPDPDPVRARHDVASQPWPGDFGIRSEY